LHPRLQLERLESLLLDNGRIRARGIEPPQSSVISRVPSQLATRAIFFNIYIFINICMRLSGIAPKSHRWQRCGLLLTHNRGCAQKELHLPQSRIRRLVLLIAYGRSCTRTVLRRFVHPVKVICYFYTTGAESRRQELNLRPPSYRLGAPNHQMLLRLMHPHGIAP
jgi:hypothetical protein